MICDIFLPIMPAIFAHWGEKYNLAQILHIYFALEKEVQSCAYIAHWGNKYNLAHTLSIGERSTILCKSCAYIAHWGIVQSCANLAHILRIREISTILCKSCANFAHMLCTDTSNGQLAHLAHLAQNAISLLPFVLC